MNADRTDTWDKNEGASALLGNKGGLAIWVRRDEGHARCAVRFGGDLPVVLMELAAIRIGYHRLIESLAKHHDMPIQTIRDAVNLAESKLTPITDHAAKITPAKGPHEQ